MQVILNHESMIYTSKKINLLLFIVLFEGRKASNSGSKIYLLPNSEITRTPPGEESLYLRSMNAHYLRGLGTFIHVITVLYLILNNAGRRN